MKLVISEKNIAARRIAEILAVGKPKTGKSHTTPIYEFRRDGEDWVSIGLKGHIMGVEFPEEFDGVELKKWKLEQLPTLAAAPVQKYPAEKGIIQSLKTLAKKADEVVIATDFDREGELIGSDAASIARAANPKAPISRVRFSAITKGEIERAFAEPSTVDECLADAGASRQDIDLIWGAVLTRYLTLANQLITRRPYGDVLSVGRVQTPTLKLIVDREKERDAFVPETYWQVRADLRAAGEEFVATHVADRFKDEASAAKAFEAALAAKGADCGARVSSVETTRRTQKPPAPFNTTSLQAAASSEGISPSQTMRIAESLYMDGLISYPRVDNTVYPASLDLRALLDTLGEVAFYREHVARIKKAGPLHPTRGNKETTDHPPIHPTGAADPDRITGSAWRIYNLVSRRFLATLEDPAVIEGTKAVIDVCGEDFVARGDVLAVPGFRAVYQYGLKKDEVLPKLGEGDTVEVLDARMDEKQTQPPARFSQGKLVQEMEKQGLGTKSTRAEIIQTLMDRRYVANDPVEPTVKGRTVIDALETYAERVTTPDMTHQLDDEMDAISEGETTRDKVVAHSRELLEDIVAVLLPRAEDVGAKLKDAADADATLGTCKKTDGDLRIKFSPKNKSYFVGCSDYPECDVTFPLPKGYKYEAVDEVCETCGTPQVKLIAFKKRPQTVCLDPACPTRQEPDIPLGPCPGDGEKPCEGEIIAHRNPNTLKRFARCTLYEACGVSYPLPALGDLVPTGTQCEACGAPMVTITTKRGPWTICPNLECPLREEKEAAKAEKAAARKSATAAKAAAKTAKPRAKRAAKKK